jgi:glycerol kinase
LPIRQTGPVTRYIAAIDQGTTSTRCLVLDADARVVAHDQREHRQSFPRPGWVEHDPIEIWRNVQAVVVGAVRRAGIGPADLAALGITNQRETTLLWDAATGRPVHPAIVWQDTRTDQLIRQLGEQDRFRARCGLPLATYFSAPKVRWLLDRDATLGQRAEAGDVRFGTIDSWLIWNLTGRHATDVTNASRTMLMNLSTLDWDPELLRAFDLPRAMLPEIRPSASVYGPARGLPGFGGVPVASALGDQQAALVGQACLRAGEAKCTYGTGSFLLLNTGEKAVPSERGLVTTVGYQLGDGPAAYALEGSIAVTGAAIQWLRDNLGIISTAAEVNELAASVPDNGGCSFVPAFSGLFAPYWRPDARGVITGLTGYVTRAHLARAALEATAWQVRDVVDAMVAESRVDLDMLKVDGGMTASELLMQFQADVLGVPVVRPTVAETTSLGAAYAAGLAVGFWPDVAAVRANWRADRQWDPQLPAYQQERGYRQWRKAVERSFDWLD